MKILTDVSLGDVRVEYHQDWARSATYLFSEENRLWHKFDHVNRTLLNNRISLLNNFIAIVGAHLQSNKFDLVAMSPKLGVMFGLLQYLKFSKKYKFVLFHFWLQDKRSGFMNFIIDYIRGVGIRAADVIIVPSYSEISNYSDRYKINKDKFEFIPFHVHSNAWKLATGSEGYIFSAGSSVRDYKTLMECAHKFKENKFILVSDKNSVDGLIIPENVELLIDIPHNLYLEKLSKCSLVVIPLKKVLRSSGQRTILEAMAMAKPVIVSDIPGTKDYIIDGKSGLLVEPENTTSLIKAITSLLDNQEYANSLGKNAYQYAKEHFSFETNFQKMFDMFNNLLGRSDAKRDVGSSL